jgi:leucyl aminopeptidase
MRFSLNSRPIRAPGRIVLVDDSRGRAGAPADLDRGVRDLIARAKSEGLFRGRPGDLFSLLVRGDTKDGNGALRSLFLVGAGKSSELECEDLRGVFATAARQLPREGEAVLDLASAPFDGLAKRLGIAEVVRAIVEGTLLGCYRYSRYKSGSADRHESSRTEEGAAKPSARTKQGSVSERGRGSTKKSARAKRGAEGFRIILDAHRLSKNAVTEARRGLEDGVRVASAVNLARDLANAPPNEIYPETLAARARAIGRASGLRVSVLTERELARESMGGILAVSKGSARKPRLIVLDYHPERGHPQRSHGRPARGLGTIVLVGKAVTFDAGGLSIKPAQGMQDMKFDMAGGAAVIAVMSALRHFRPGVRVVGLVPSSENVIGSDAYRPGDIVRMAAGRTVEIVNTDAEGRLLLADALHYARRFEPDAVIDIATLTGAIVIALGAQISGLFANDDALEEAVEEASEESGDRVWRMPIFPEAHEALKSQFADLKNSGGREAGASTAAAFLESFTHGYRWAHLDIAGTASTPKAKGVHPAGATGVGVRLLLELVNAWKPFAKRR